MFKRLLDKLLLCVGLSRASVTRYYAGSAEHNQRALEERIKDIGRLRFAVNYLEIRYRQQCDKQAYDILEKLTADQLGQTNQLLIDALTESRGAQWAGSATPPIEVI